VTPYEREALRVREWARRMFSQLPAERRSQRNYSLTFVSHVLHRSKDEVRALVELGALSAGRTKTGRLVFSIDDLLAFKGWQPTVYLVRPEPPQEQDAK